MASSDWPSVSAIFEEGIASGNATFETSPPSWEQWDSSHLETCRLVAVDSSGTVVGWAALSPVSSRHVYRGWCEVSVYIAQVARSRGVGRALLERLIADSEGEGRWTLQAGIFPENRASVSLHEGCGFRVIGTHERVGNSSGVWRDTLLLERRSQVAGL